MLASAVKQSMPAFSHEILTIYDSTQFGTNKKIGSPAWKPKSKRFIASLSDLCLICFQLNLLRESTSASSSPKDFAHASHKSAVVSCVQNPLAKYSSIMSSVYRVGFAICYPFLQDPSLLYDQI